MVESHLDMLHLISGATLNLLDNLTRPSGSYHVCNRTRKAPRLSLQSSVILWNKILIAKVLAPRFRTQT